MILDILVADAILASKQLVVGNRSISSISSFQKANVHLSDSSFFLFNFEAEMSFKYLHLP